MNTLNTIALWVGWAVMVLGGIAATVALAMAVFNYVGSQWATGHDMYRIAQKVYEEKRLWKQRKRTGVNAN